VSAENSEHSPKQDAPAARSFLQKKLCSSANLFSAWLLVRSKARYSKHQPTRAEAALIDENPLRLVRSLQKRLREDRFKFAPQRAVIKTKKASGKRRGLVISPIESRVVQRAILNVFQDDHPKSRSLLGSLPIHLSCPTSVGGTPERGVKYAVNLIQTAIGSGKTYYIRSDIRSFFDNINRHDIVSYLNSQVVCRKTVELFSSALDVEFENIDDVRDDLDLFPDHEVGVAQGNSLSCLAANLALRNFDALMNGRGITTVRYVDDFIVLGKNLSSVRKALAAGKAELMRLGLEAYSPEERPDKAREGSVKDGVEFIGCFFRDGSVIPSAASRDRLLGAIDSQFRNARREITLAIKSGNPRRAEPMFVQELALLDRRIRGWGDAYGFTDDRSCFRVLDEQIQTRISDFYRWFSRSRNTLETIERRRAWGIALLGDTQAP
jgi:RNA-directed DNA polymerase